MLKSTVFSAIALILFASVAVSGEMPKKSEKMSMEGMTTFEGTIVCSSCDLKATEGARSNCKEFGHTDALKTADGKYINFLPNKFSKELHAGAMYEGKKLKLSGNYFAAANLLDVQSIEVDGLKMTWCDKHEKMDGCMSGM